MKQEKSCGAIVIADGKILLVKHNRGHYGFPKGHVKPGETEMETAIREVKEETNVDIEIISPKRYINSYMPDPNVHKDVIFFLAKPLNNETKPQLSEVKEVLWIPVDEISEYLQFQNAIDVWENEMIEDVKNEL